MRHSLRTHPQPRRCLYHPGDFGEVVYPALVIIMYYFISSSLFPVAPVSALAPAPVPDVPVPGWQDHGCACSARGAVLGTEKEGKCPNGRSFEFSGVLECESVLV